MFKAKKTRICRFGIKALGRFIISSDRFQNEFRLSQIASSNRLISFNRAFASFFVSRGNLPPSVR